MFRKIIIISVFALAVLLRFYKLGTVPQSLNADEAAIGYNAYSILKTGRDEYGEKMPLAFRSFDDYKAPVYIYLTSLSVFAFGLNNFSVRFISALSGSLTVVFMFFFVRLLLESTGMQGKRDGPLSEREVFAVSAVTALLLAISPWHLQFSRSAYEANLSLSFLVMGLVFFYKGLRTGPYIMPAGLFLVLSMWSYHAPRVFVPLLVVGLAVLYWRQLLRQRGMLIVALLLSIFLLLPLFALTFSPTGLVRAKGISSLEDPQILAQSVYWIGADNNSFIGKLFHNRRVEYAREITKGYLVHFDPLFLFLERAQAKYRAPGMGLLYLWELPVIIVGIYEVAKIRQKWSLLLFLWLILSPVAAAPTLWLPSAVRTLVMLPVLQIFTAFGLVSVLRGAFRQSTSIAVLSSITVLVILFLSFFYYLHMYYVHLPLDFAADWQYGRKEVIDSVVQLKDQYDKIVVSTSLDQPQAFFLYYLGYDPQKYLAEGGTVSGKFDAEGNRFDKYVFTPPAKYVPLKGEKVLYVASVGETQITGRILRQIKYPNGNPAFIVYD